MMNQMDPATLQSLMGGGFGGMGGFGGFGGAGATGTGSAASTAPAQDPKEKYAAQLQQMKDMGFTDEDTNLEVLKQ